MVYGGELTTRLKANTYRVPEVCGGEIARYSLYNHWPALDIDYFSSFIVYVRHINAVSGIVTMQACFTRCFRP
jgi:hypothetical protein